MTLPDSAGKNAGIMNGQFTPQIIERIQKTGVIAVLTVDKAEDGVPLAQALIAGGVDAMELTLRTPAALDALREVKRHVPEMLAGIGTILTTEQVKQVADLGAAFGVAPGTNPRIISEAQKLGLPFAPGVATPSDIERAVECGCTLLKFFPAEPSGGLAYLKSMAAPYAHLKLRYVPLGGLNAGNMRTYLAEPSVLALGGSWLASREAVQKESGDVILSGASILAEVGELFAGTHARPPVGTTTVFKSVGIAAEDLAAAALVHRLAKSETGS